MKIYFENYAVCRMPRNQACGTITTADLVANDDLNRR